MSEVVTIELDKLYEPYFNPRKHPQEQLYNLSESLREFGQRRTISVWPDGKGKYEVLAGNGIKKAAELAKLKALDCTIAPKEWDEVRRKAYALADNQGGYEDDMVKVAQILEEVRASGEIELAALGSSSEKVDALLEELANQALQDAKPGLGGDDFEIPEELEPKAKFGDVWQLGRHKLAVIDSTNAEQVKWFLDGVKVDQLITDPPYGVDYSDKNDFLERMGTGGNSVKTAIENDAIEDYRSFFANFLKAIPFAEYNTCYVFMADLNLHVLRLAFDDARITTATPPYIIWDKGQGVFGRSDYNAQHETAIYGWKGKHKFYGGFDKTTVVSFPKPQKSELHPTMKPLDLFQQLMLDGSALGAKVYDPFLGSGTTLIASERTGRTCYGCEISPKYADVIIKRWEMETGLGAQLLSSIELAQV